jgi:hypothetical protein
MPCFVRNGKLFPSAGTARVYNLAAILSAHALTKSMLVLTLTVRWLKCTFHSGGI